MFLCDVSFRYDDEEQFRPFVVNCQLADVGLYVQRISNEACVSQVIVTIHSYSIEDISVPKFHEFTL